MRLLWKLLRKNISIAQIAGFAVANLLGVVVLLVGVEFFNDTNRIFGESDSFMKNEYLIISKKVSLLGAVVGQNGSFPDKDIAELEGKSFVKNVGKFRSSDFRVYASVGFGGSGISSDIFFESVPDSYLDVESAKWSFKEGDKNIPIIIPRNYLNLYNFGFSQSRNLPRLTESAISTVKFDVKITGNGVSDSFKGNIVGFSNRLNTILVPDSFMRWAETKFSKNPDKNATRLIIEVENSADKDLLSFFKDKNYDIEGGGLQGGEMAYLSRMITMIVLVIGFVVTLLSIFILILSLFLLIEKNSSKIETLILMGYSPWQIIMPYSAVVAVVNGVIIILSLLIALMLRGVYVDMLSDIFSFASSTTHSVYLVATIVYIFISLLNLVVIRRKVLSLVKK